MWLGLGRVLDVSLREVQHVLQYMHAWITDLAACLEIFEDPIYLSFPQRETLGQRIFCSLLEMHQPWSSRIKMIQCFKIYRALLDYVGLFYFVWFAVLNFGLVQETPLLRAYLLREVSYSTNNSHLWLTLIKQLLLLAFPVCLFPCTNPIFHVDGPIHSYSWCVCLVCLWISGHLNIHVSTSISLSCFCILNSGRLRYMYICICIYPSERKKCGSPHHGLEESPSGMHPTSCGREIDLCVGVGLNFSEQ